MKKTFLALGLLSAMAFSAQAQDAVTTSDFKPAAGNISVELNALSPFSGDGAAPFRLGETFGGTPSLRLRYFLSDNMAFRIQFNISANKYKQDLGTKSDASSTVDGSAPTSGSSNTTSVTYKATSGRTLVAIAPGLEIHKNVSERLSVYYGGYVDFAIQTASGKITGAPGSGSRSHTATSGATSSSSTTSGEYSYEVKGENFGTLNSISNPPTNWSAIPSSNTAGPSIVSPGFFSSSTPTIRDRSFLRYGLVGVIGADYYITKALYLGVELGWGFNATSFRKITKTEKATNINTTTTSVPAGPAPTAAVNVSVTTKTEENKDSQFVLSPTVNGAFRLGFWF